MHNLIIIGHRMLEGYVFVTSVSSSCLLNINFTFWCFQNKIILILLGKYEILNLCMQLSFTYIYI